MVSRPLCEGVDWNVIAVIQPYRQTCRPLYEGVDWNFFLFCPVSCAVGRPLYEGVDWNNGGGILSVYIICRPLYEGVDWNRLTPWRDIIAYYVALFTRAWIEISSPGETSERGTQSPSLRGRGLKFVNLIIKHVLSGRPLYEGMDWNVDYMLLMNGQDLSPSLRGRGLKYASENSNRSADQSPSSRGRGLKYTDPLVALFHALSPSSRGRGLKS